MSTATNGNGNNGKLIWALPSKGRLMDQCNAALAKAGLKVVRSGPARGYKGEIDGLSGVEINFVSSSEIAQFLKSGAAHLGVTGEDLIRETMEDADTRVRFVRPLGFGRADVVVAVPDCWLDVRRMADLEEMSLAYRRVHGRRVRVATKYMNLTRRFFSAQGRHRLSHRREPGRHRGHAGRGLGRADRRHHHHRRDPQGQRPAPARRRPDPQLAGQPGGLQGRALVARACRPGTADRRALCGLAPVIPEFRACPRACPEGQRNIRDPGLRTLRLRLWVPDSRCATSGMTAEALNPHPWNGPTKAWS